jgi:hypothetical protein
MVICTKGSCRPIYTDRHDEMLQQTIIYNSTNKDKDEKKGIIAVKNEDESKAGEG